MAATKPAFNPPGKKGDMIFSALVKLAALIVLCCWAALSCL